MSESDRHINFKLMRDHILSLQDGDAPRSGKKHWRSLEELADTPVFREFVAREFPQQAEGWNDPIERRTFIKLMGASLALAGLSGCVYQPPEKIVPYVKQPEEAIPGKSLFYATAAPLFGAATPILVRSNEGRPTKIEGNPDHPNNRPGSFPEEDPARDPRGSSATDIFAQASVLGLYDPDRSQTITYREAIQTWTAFVGALRTALDEQRPKQGAGIRFLTETVTSPTLGAQFKELLTAFPQAKWHQYEPANRDNARAGAVMALGQPVNTIYKFDQAQRVVSLDSDFLSASPGSLRYARDFMARRRLTETNKEINRLYVIETTPSNTGAKADHRWVIKPSEFEGIARRLSAAVGAAGGSGGDWVDAVARDLQQHKGASIVIAGESQPPAVHALAHAMNSALGNVGKTVFYTDPLEVNPVDQRQSLQDLVNDLDGGRVELLVIIGGNPVYNSPVDMKLTFDRLQKAKLRVHLSEYKDETTAFCHWHIPQAHYLESWGDARSYDGTVSIVQPLIQPLYDGRTAHEVLALFSEQYDRKPLEIVRAFWQSQGSSLLSGAQAASSPTPAASPTPARTEPASEQARTPAAPAPAASPSPSIGSDFESWWRKVLHDGFIPNSSLPTKTLSANASAAQQQPTTAQPGGGSYELVFRTDPSIYDGRFANNGWLQELPKPLTKLTWENAALISPNTAQQLGIENKVGQIGGDVHVDSLRITYRGQTISEAVPAWVTPGQPDNVVTLHLGYGRTRGGRVAGTVDEPVGFNAFSIRYSDSPWSATGVQVQKATTQVMLASTQIHFLMEDPKFSHEPRDIVRSKTLEQALHGEKHEEHKLPTIYPPVIDYKNQGMNTPNYAWGMSIDLNSCIGCNACTAACQSENNIPVVGKKEVARSREMHWIRVDTYFSGEAANPGSTDFMPVPCMHCENAPCEPVCPVHATVHSAEGLNDMVYNRCVGTKYCSNNCPYKVRRFNFFLYQDWDTPTYQLMRNPDVSVRSRGVMEKCTYCVQRIQSAKINSEIEGRKVYDGEIVTACQAVCPTEAIVFGDVNDPNSRVSKLKANERNYSLLEDLNTVPRTTYLSTLRNPNPEIKG
jgi:molybdopterin-containing oxidoreductase family iron-sulfur binding subunit